MYAAPPHRLARLPPPSIPSRNSSNLRHLRAYVLFLACLFIELPNERLRRETTPLLPSSHLLLLRRRRRKEESEKEKRGYSRFPHQRRRRHRLRRRRRRRSCRRLLRSPRFEEKFPTPPKIMGAKFFSLLSQSHARRRKREGRQEGGREAVYLQQASGQELPSPPVAATYMCGQGSTQGGGWRHFERGSARTKIDAPIFIVRTRFERSISIFEKLRRFSPRVSD